jgi:hypothetical protein
MRKLLTGLAALTMVAAVLPLLLTASATASTRQAPRATTPRAGLTLSAAHRAASPTDFWAGPGSATTRPGAPQSASGGGCTDSLPIDIDAEVDIASCISENSSRNIASDAHFTYLGGPWSLVSCKFTISIRDDSIPTTVARQTFYDCNYDPGVVYHSAVPGHHYHTYIWALLTLSNGQTYLGGDVFNSPEQIAG